MHYKIINRTSLQTIKSRRCLLGDDFDAQLQLFSDVTLIKAMEMVLSIAENIFLLNRFSQKPHELRLFPLLMVLRVAFCFLLFSTSQDYGHLLREESKAILWRVQRALARGMFFSQESKIGSQISA